MKTILKKYYSPKQRLQIYEGVFKNISYNNSFGLCRDINQIARNIDVKVNSNFLICSVETQSKFTELHLLRPNGYECMWWGEKSIVRWTALLLMIEILKQR